MNITDLEKKLTTSRDNEEKVKFLNELSITNLDNAPEKTLEYGMKALELAKKLNNHKEIVIALTNIANIHFKLSKYNDALKYYYKVIEKIGATENKQVRANCLNKVGIIYYKQCNYDKALEYLQLSLKIHEDISNDNRGIADLMNNFGLVYWRLKYYDKAIEYHQKALIIREDNNFLKDTAVSLNNIGLIYYELSKYDIALSYYQKSLNIVEELNELQESSMLFNNIGLIHYKTGNLEEALNCYLKCIKKAEEIADKRNIANTLSNIGDIYAEMERYDDALSYLEKSLKLSKEIESKKLIMDCYEQFFEVYKKIKNYKKSLIYFELFSKMKDTIYSQESSKKIAELQTSYETEKKEKEAEIYKLKNIELAQANQQLEKEIIERKKAEETIKVGRGRLKMLNKIIRHDLSNDFIVIKSAVRLYKKRSNLTMIDEIEKRVDKSLNIISSYRRYESFIDEHIDLEEIAVNELLEKLILDFPEMKFIITGSCKVLADETLISVFTNLITNSIIHGNATQMEVKISLDKHICSMKFCDNGIGIAPDIMENIFEEGFYYGKSGHTGVGLHIVRQTIEYFGGTITVEKNEPNGATFVINLKKAL